MHTHTSKQPGQVVLSLFVTLKHAYLEGVLNSLTHMASMLLLRSHGVGLQMSRGLFLLPSPLFPCLPISAECRSCQFCRSAVMCTHL